MKKIVVSSLVTLALMSSFIAVHAEEQAPSLPTSVSFLMSNGVVAGDADGGNLRLGDPINRAEFMKLITSVVRKERPGEEYSDCLADIHKEWFAADVCWAESRGYIDGYDDGTFKAGNNVTHAEALKVIHEAFHLDYQRYLPVVNQDLWYDKYLKSSLGQKIAEESVETKLADKATRGEVFEYIYRTMVISDRDSFVYQTSLDDAYGEWYKRFSKETRELTRGEEELLLVIEKTLEHGFSPTTSSGTAMLDINMTNSKFPGEKITARLDLTSTGGVTGSGSLLEATDASVDLAFDIFANLDNQSMKVKGKIGVDLAMNNERLYFKLRTIEMVQADLPLIQKVTMEQMISKLSEHKEKWYHIDLTGLGIDATLGHLTDSSIIGRVRELLQHTTAPLLDIDIDASEPMHSMLMTINPEQVIEYVQKGVLLLDQETNLYEVRNDMRKVMPKLIKFLNSLSYVIGYMPGDHLQLSEQFIMEPSQINDIDNINLLIESFAKSDSQYPEQVEIQLPEESMSIEVLLEALGLSGGESA